MVHEQHKKNPVGYREDYLHIENSGYGDNEDSRVKLVALFPPVHSLYVVEIVVLQFFPLELERICDQTCLRGPGFRTQMHLDWNLKPLEFNYTVGKRKRRTLKGYLNGLLLNKTEREHVSVEGRTEHRGMCKITCRHEECLTVDCDLLDLLQDLFFHLRVSADVLPGGHDASLLGQLCQLLLVRNHEADHIVLFTVDKHKEAFKEKLIQVF